VALVGGVKPTAKTETRQMRHEGVVAYEFESKAADENSKG
jgi:hypothetical protein